MNTKVTDWENDIADALGAGLGPKQGAFETKQSFLARMEKLEEVTEKTITDIITEELGVLARGGFAKEEVTKQTVQEMVEAYEEELAAGESVGDALEALADSAGGYVDTLKDNAVEAVAAANETIAEKREGMNAGLTAALNLHRDAFEDKAEATPNLNDDARAEGQADKAQAVLRQQSREIVTSIEAAMSEAAAMAREMASIGDIVPSVQNEINDIEASASLIASLLPKAREAAKSGDFSKISELKQAVASAKRSIEASADSAKTEMSVASAEIKGESYANFSKYWEEYNDRNRDLIHAAANYSWEDGYDKWLEGQEAREQIVSDFIRANPEEAKKIWEQNALPKAKEILANSTEPEKKQMGINLSEMLKMKQMERLLTNDRLSGLRDIMITEVLTGVEFSDIVINSNGRLEGKGGKLEQVSAILKAPEFIDDLKAAKAEVARAHMAGQTPTLSADQQNALSAAKALKAGWEHMLETHPERTLEEVIRERADSPEEAEKLLAVARLNGVLLDVKAKDFSQIHEEQANSTIRMVALERDVNESEAKELIINGEISRKDLSNYADRQLSLTQELNIARNLAYQRATASANARAAIGPDGIGTLAAVDAQESPEWQNAFNEVYEQELKQELIKRSANNGDVAVYVEVTYEMNDQELASEREALQREQQNNAFYSLDPDLDKEPEVLQKLYQEKLVNSEEGQELIIRFGKESADKILLQQASSAVTMYVDNRKQPNPDRMDLYTKEAYEHHLKSGLGSDMAYKMAQYEAEQAKEKSSAAIKQEQADGAQRVYQTALDTLKNDPANEQARQDVRDYFYKTEYARIADDKTLTFGSPEDIATEKQATAYAEAQLKELTQVMEVSAAAPAAATNPQDRIGGTAPPKGQEIVAFSTLVAPLHQHAAMDITRHAANVNETPEEKAKREAQEAVGQTQTAQTIIEHTKKANEATQATGMTTVADAAKAAQDAGTVGGEQTTQSEVADAGKTAPAQTVQTPDDELIQNV